MDLCVPPQALGTHPISSTAMVSGTRSKRHITNPPKTSKNSKASKTLKTSKTSKTLTSHNQNARKKNTSSASGTAADTLNDEEEIKDPDFEDEDEDTQEIPNSSKTIPTKKIFRSRFPQLELDTFEEQLDQWTIAKLRDCIVKQNSCRSSAHKDIKDTVKLLRMDFEKQVLMVALMAGVPEVVIWNLMGFGKYKGKANPWIRFLSFCIKCLGDKLPERDNKDEWVARNQKMADEWAQLSKDEQNIFRDPYFFALAGIPDYSTHVIDTEETVEDDPANGVNVQQFDASTTPATVHQLSESDKEKYQPIFNKLVNVDKVHMCHGKPEPLPSIATLQKRSLLAVRKAHQDFAVICQRNQISYYLTTASCGGVNGWSQTFSNDVDFAKWALDKCHVPTKFANYVHGKDAVQEIKKKTPQASNARRSQLTMLLNNLMRAHARGIPKVPDPVSYIQTKRWKVQIVQKPGSSLSSQDLLVGHRKATDSIVKAWIKDIQDKNFVLEALSESEINQQDATLQESANPALQNDQSDPNRSSSTEQTRYKGKKRRVVSDSESSDTNDV
ncbi:uncharacterized protein MELLADRAFT_89771 [Melampsora larici-populina 98AG31]|uniref:Uncharacterized protein n=1 Tax=Melampsora larici-populina (strain 98AG31 / pathotype 3-4-7) TaxID=747676 RepID=F4RUK2_MELLP|nr:uncharacterized protein MELLADRAFT_89771 [Melampsora larici-populina 98AG31]EGG03946.1 hypothetical protein MELLADRAFT_89771 [Melampsora larici-populina 98AG31]